MINVKRFAIVFICTYALISLPAILGFGYVIDWVDDATILQRLKGYVAGGLAENYIIKLVISGIVAVVINYFLYLKQK